MFAKYRKFQSGVGKGRAGFVGLQKVSTTAVGNVDAGVDNLISHTLEANSLYKNGQAVRITAFGTFGANGNNKQVKLLFGSTELWASGVVTSNAKSWEIEAVVIRTSATAQVASARASEDAHADPLVTTPAETCASDIVIKVTGEAVATDDIICKGLLVEILTQ